LTGFRQADTISQVSAMNENSSLLASYCKDVGVSLFGTASILDARDDFDLPDELKHRFAWAVSIGQRLSSAVLDDLQDGPTPLYFHHYRQLNLFLDRAAFLIASRIQDLGYEALPVAASQVIDWGRQRGHVSHKAIARLAGLGWIGRNNLLVNPQYGAQIRLVSVLTTMPLDPAEPLPNGCGECRSCRVSCPANAIKDKPGDFDHIGCYEKLKEFRSKGLVSQFVCGLCVKACPRRSKSPDHP
jgi:epoxyqueuosine reductase